MPFCVFKFMNYVRGLKAQSRGGEIMSASQLPRVSEVTDLSKVSMTATFLDQCNSLLQSNLNLRHTDKLLQRSLHVFAVNGGHHRKSQLDTMQRSVDRGHPAQMDTLHHISCIYGSRNIIKKETERLQEPDYQEVFCETVFPLNGCINKIITIAISMDMITWKGVNFTKFYPQTKNHVLLLTGGKRRISLSLG